MGFVSEANSSPEGPGYTIESAVEQLRFVRREYYNDTMSVRSRPQPLNNFFLVDLGESTDTAVQYRTGRSGCLIVWNGFTEALGEQVPITRQYSRSCSFVILDSLIRHPRGVSYVICMAWAWDGI